MKPVNLFWSRISEEETEIVKRTFSEINSILNIELKTFGNWYANEGAYGSLMWYEDNALRLDSDQLIGDQILMRFASEPWQKSPHIDFAVFGKDLTATNGNGYLNFVFGLTSPNLGTVISTYRFQHLLQIQRDLSIRRVIMHEFFHAVGLLPKWRTTEVNVSLGEHCTNICVMRQGLSVPEWLRYAQEEKQRGIILCSHCFRDLQRIQGL